MADQTVREFTKKDETVAGDIRIGAAEGEAMRIPGRCMKQLKEKYPAIQYHLYAGDTEMLKEKLESGFLDFLMIAENPDLSRFHSIPMPLKDRWGLIIRNDDPLAQKETITKEDLMEIPLIISRQALHQDLRILFGDDAHRIHIAATYDLAHNASLLVQEGYGALLAFDHLADLGPSTGLTFRSISPALYTSMHLIYRKYQIFSPQAEIFLDAVSRLAEESS